MQEKIIGKMKKLSVEHFRKPGRKLYLVPLLVSADKEGKGMSKEYLAKIEAYWNEVKGRVNDLQTKLGKINKIYHELVDVSGEKGFKVIKNLNKKSYQIAKALSQKGAVLEAIENGDLVKESMDWARCLAIYPQSEKALRKIYQFYIEVMQEREGHIAKKIDETLKNDEIGILFIRENNNLKFPSDIEIFRVHPSVLDDIHRYLRDFQSKIDSAPQGKTKQGDAGASKDSD